MEKLTWHGIELEFDNIEQECPENTIFTKILTSHYPIEKAQNYFIKYGVDGKTEEIK